MPVGGDTVRLRSGGWEPARLEAWVAPKRLFTKVQAALMAGWKAVHIYGLVVSASLSDTEQLLDVKEKRELAEKLRGVWSVCM